MEIKTKYNIGNNVCTLYNDRIVYGTITSIKIEIDCRADIQIRYHIQNTTYMAENAYIQEKVIFKTKEELLEKLTKCDYL